MEKLSLTTSIISGTIAKPKILMVDDKPENLIALERLLGDLPIELYKAVSGNEALKLTLYHDFSLVLLDIQMPEMDGYELAEILRSEDKTARIPFIFISAIYTDHIHVFKGYEKGAFSFVTKPFEPYVLLNKIDFFIEKYQQDQALKKAHLILEKRVKERTLELERSNKELEQFAYVASHDLQEPLRTTSNFVSLIKDKYHNKLDEQGQEFLQFVTDSTERMRTLVHGLLEYSRIGRNKEKKWVDCNELVNDVIMDIDLLITENKAEVSVAKLPNRICAYPEELKQMFQNLITNAIKFKKANTSPKIKITSSEETDHWKFQVKDNGIGIEDQFHDRIFIIFQRLHLRNEVEGNGIGLSHCKKIAQLHLGKIWVESNLEEGSTFFFTITKNF